MRFELWMILSVMLDRLVSWYGSWQALRIITQEELARFYQAFIEVAFKQSLRRVFLTTKVRTELTFFCRPCAAVNDGISIMTPRLRLCIQCLTKHGEERRCLIELTYHSSHVPDGRPLSAYQLRIWPLGHRSLPMAAPPIRPVVQIS